MPSKWYLRVYYKKKTQKMKNIKSTSIRKSKSNVNIRLSNKLNIIQAKIDNENVVKLYE